MKRNNRTAEDIELPEENDIIVNDSEETASKKKKGKKGDKNGIHKPIVLIIVLMVVFSIILVISACVSNFINKELDVTDSNSEVSLNDPNAQFLPTGFVFDDEEADDGKKSAIRGFIDFITGKNKKKTPSKSDDDGKDKTNIAIGNTPSSSEVTTPDTSETADDAPDSLKNTDSSTSVKRKEEFYNFLVLAKDKGGGNTDTIIVVSFDVPNETISLLQIPRDTSVNYKNSIRKINSVYSSGYSSTKGKTLEKTEGGISALSTCLVQNFGIVIDRYVVVDIEGFKSIVDTIGGVDVYVQQDMKYKDIYQDLDINLKKGMNHLDGEKAEDFVRFRKGYINQDLGRMDAQKIFMSAFLKKLFSVSTVTKVPELIGHVMEYVTTNVSVQEATYLGTRVFDMGMSGITMHNLQGTAGAHTYYNGASYFSPYKKANIDLVNQYFNVFNKDLGPENVNPRMLVGESGNGKYDGGKTAEEIDNDNPDLMFSYR